MIMYGEATHNLLTTAPSYYYQGYTPELYTLPPITMSTVVLSCMYILLCELFPRKRNKKTLVVVAEQAELVNHSNFSDNFQQRVMKESRATRWNISRA